MKELTKAEEQIMRYFWKIKKGFLKDVVSQFDDPKPANTTVSTVIKVLVKKNYVNFTLYGKTNEYYPIIDKYSFVKKRLKNVVSSYFDNSYKNFASFFTNEQDLSIEELEELKDILDKKIKEKKNL